MYLSSRATGQASDQISAGPNTNQYFLASVLLFENEETSTLRVTTAPIPLFELKFNDYNLFCVLLLFELKANDYNLLCEL